MKNYYEVLDIPSTASNDDIKKAFRKKAIKYHPDKHFGDSYFANRFIEVKEAYDLLSDSNLRAEYDVKYKSYYINTQVQSFRVKEEKQKEAEKEEQFFYDPYKPFYSTQDRIVNDSPQFNPKINHWGDVLSNNDDFFILPKNIGKIISGYTTLSKDQKPSSGFLGGLFNSFKHSCSFMGVNGFAFYSISGSRQSISKSIEINFKDVTDLFSVSQKRSLNFNYQNTAYGFEWSRNGKVIADFNGVYYDKNDNPGKSEAIEYWTNKWAEKYWTVYLLDNMEATIERNGYLEFKVFDGKGFKPYIKLGIGHITFMNGKSETTYRFNEIKNIYIKGHKLYIESKDYEKKFMLFQSGNKSEVSLVNLSNRQFFIRAIELLLGWNFS